MAGSFGRPAAPASWLGSMPDPPPGTAAACRGTRPRDSSSGSSSRLGVRRPLQAPLSRVISTLAARSLAASSGNAPRLGARLSARREQRRARGRTDEGMPVVTVRGCRGPTTAPARPPRRCAAAAGSSSASPSSSVLVLGARAGPVRDRAARPGLRHARHGGARRRARCRSSRIPDETTYPTDGRARHAHRLVVGNPRAAARAGSRSRAPGSTRPQAVVPVDAVFPAGVTDEQIASSRTRPRWSTRSRRPSPRRSPSSATTSRASVTVAGVAEDSPAEGVLAGRRRRSSPSTARDVHDVAGAARGGRRQRHRQARDRRRSRATARRPTVEVTPDRRRRRPPVLGVGVAHELRLPVRRRHPARQRRRPERRHDVRARHHRQAHARRAQRRRGRRGHRHHRRRGRRSARSAASGRRCYGAADAGADVLPRARSRTATRSSGTCPTASTSSRVDDPRRRARGARDRQRRRRTPRSCADLHARQPEYSAAASRQACRSSVTLTSSALATRDPTQSPTEHEAHVTSAQQPTHPPAADERRSPSPIVDRRRARDRVLRLRRPLRRHPLVRPARLPQRAHHAVGRRRRRCSSSASSRMAVPVWVEHPDRLPLAPGLREAQLAARPLPAGHRAAASPRHVRHSRRCSASSPVSRPPSRWQTTLIWLNRTPDRADRPAVRPRHLVLPLRAAVLPRRRRLRLGRRAHRAAPRARHQLPLRRDPRRAAARCASRRPRASRSRSRPALYLLLQAVSIWLDQYATLTDASADSSPAPATPTSTRPSPAARSSPASRASSPCSSSSPRSSAAGACPSSARRCSSSPSLLIGSLYPWVVQRFQVDPSARTLEAAYIQRNIDVTRTAYGVADVEEIPYDATTDAEPGALRADAETTANIRIIDPALVTDAFAQLEQFRQYYQFPTTSTSTATRSTARRQDTVIAVRDLNLAGLGDAHDLVQPHARLHARLRRRRRLRQPALGRRPARLPRVRHPDDRRRSATSSRASTSARTRRPTRSSARPRAASRSSSTTRRATRAPSRRTPPSTATAGRSSTTSSRSSSTRSSSSRADLPLRRRQRRVADPLRPRPARRACRRSRRT